MKKVMMIAKYYGYPPQGEDEADRDFRNRIAGLLRDDGHLIEAHEVYRGKRWDSDAGGDDVVTGITGAIAQALAGVDYGSKSERQIGDDIAVGHVVLDDSQEVSLEMRLIAALMSRR